MIEYSVFTQIDIDRITQAQMMDDSDPSWADAFQDFLNQEATNGWRLVSLKWNEKNRVPHCVVFEKNHL